jgi:hypothetical protein
MKMRVTMSVLVTSAVLWSAPAAMAYDTFIPAGTGYSPSVESLPSFDSEDGRIIQQSDVYETEIYMKARKRVEEESRFRDFFSNAESTGSDTHIDY